jgi:uncharacterized protein YjiS (DUF1127 family)
MPKKKWVNIRIIHKMIRQLFNRIIQARTESARRRIARLQLYKMTDRELQDLGINRYDIERVILTGKAL